jgi:Na+-transporting NADH:ubiquinone oxidoreductase subunit NqrF
LFYGARCPDLLIYRPLVNIALQRCPNLQVWFLAEQDADGNNCILGLIDAATVFKHIAHPLSVTYYIAGPPVMISSLVSGLGQHGVISSCIIADAWE